MKSNDFRRLTLSFPETAERVHMQHPDFRVAGKIFATLGYPDEDFAMVKLTPLEQEMFVQAQPARRPTVRRALEAAWRLAAPQQVIERFLSNRESWLVPVQS